MATTIKLPPELKQRVASVLKGTGKSAHAFMLEAIDRETTQAERRKEFVEDALRSEKEARRSGQAFGARAVHEYLDAKLRGAKVKRPKARAWRK